MQSDLLNELEEMRKENKRLKLIILGNQKKIEVLKSSLKKTENILKEVNASLDKVLK